MTMSPRTIVATALILTAVRCDTTPRIEVVNVGDIFTEDKPTSFTCYPDFVTKHTRFLWTITDDKSGNPVPVELPWRLASKPRKPNSRGTDVFSVLMRRDLSNHKLHCFVFEEIQIPPHYRESEFLIPKIRKTTSVDEVVLNGRNLTLGKPIRLWCDVKSKIADHKVYLRTNLKFTPSSRHWPLKVNWTRYEVDLGIKAQKKHIGAQWQCIVATNGLDSNKGVVFSQKLPLIVHYLEFPKNVTVNDEDKQKVILHFSVFANPAPQQNYFVIARLETPSKREMTPSSQWCHVRPGFGKDAEHKFMVLMAFRPEASGTYAVRYRSAFLNENGPNFTVTLASPTSLSSLKSLPLREMPTPKSLPTPTTAPTSTFRPNPKTETPKDPSLFYIGMFVFLPIALGLTIIVTFVFISCKRKNFFFTSRTIPNPKKSKPDVEMSALQAHEEDDDEC